EDDDVCFYVCGINSQVSNCCDFARQELRVRVILLQTLGRFFQRDKSARGKDSRLAHASTEHFAVDASFVDEFLRTDDHRANRRAESFRKAEHYGVETARHVSNRFAERNRGVENSSAI